MAIDFDEVPRYVRKEIEKGSRAIKQGERGQRVLRVQEWLTHHGIHTAIDADFGPATQRCVERFQTAKGIDASGRVDTKTWEALVEPMRRALQPPENVARLSPARAVRKIAQQHLKQHPIEIGGANRGPWVRLYCGGRDGPDWAWCAGFVSLVMNQAYFYLPNTSAPIKGSVSCDSLAAQGQRAGLFVPESDVTSERRSWSDFGGCCIFLRRRTATDWTHTGFALGASGPARETVFETIEGNTNDEGSREGYEACKRTRSVVRSNYDFIAFA